MGRVRREDGGERWKRTKEVDDCARIYPEIIDGEVGRRCFTFENVTHIVATEQTFRADGRSGEANTHSILLQ